MGSGTVTSGSIIRYWAEEDVTVSILNAASGSEQVSLISQNGSLKDNGDTGPGGDLVDIVAAGLRLRPDQVATRLKEIGVDPRRRAQTLDLDEWAKVTQAMGDLRSG